MQSSRSVSTSVRFPLLAPVAVLALALGLGACKSDQGTGTQSVSADTWATVDGRPIAREEVEKVFRRAQDPNAKLSDEEAMTAKLSILNELILQDILLAKARAANIQLTDAELDKAFAERKQNMDDAQFEEELKKRSLSSADMRETLRRELLTNKLMEQDVTSKVNVTEQEITEFFNANKAQFTVPEESYRIAQIVVTPNDEPQQANRTGNDATTPQEAQFKVRMIMELLKTGASFADLAMDYSEDPETAPRGGDIGLMPVSALKKTPEPLQKAVIGQKPGTVNVATVGGNHSIIAVIAHEPAGERTLDTPGVKDMIREGLKTRKEQLLRTAYLTAARNDAEIRHHLARRIVDNQGKVQ